MTTRVYSGLDQWRISDRLSTVGMAGGGAAVRRCRRRPCGAAAGVGGAGGVGESVGAAAGAGGSGWA